MAHQHHQPAGISSAIEDYAKAIYALELRAGDAVTTNALAERLGVTPGSASVEARPRPSAGPRA